MQKTHEQHEAAVNSNLAADTSKSMESEPMALARMPAGGPEATPTKLSKYRPPTRWRELLAPDPDPDRRSRELSIEIPARVNADLAAKLLGFTAHDIPVLIQERLLVPLGNPMPNAVKYFPAAQLERLAQSVEWLHEATYVLAEYWRHKNSGRRGYRQRSLRSSGTRAPLIDISSSVQPWS